MEAHRCVSVKSIPSRNLKVVDSELLSWLDGGKSASDNNLWFFEIAWEVAHQVGGINTVLRSKAAISVEEMGDQYCLIGPYFEKNANREVEIVKPRVTEPMYHAIEKMKELGFRVVLGRWLIEGYPKVLLFDINWAMSKLDEWKDEIWRSSYIGVPWSDHDANCAVVFGFVTAIFLAEYRKLLPPSSYVLAHFHEWIAGIGLIVCRTRHINIATVFTTHATMLGRHLCAGNVDFYNNLQKLSYEKEAGDRSIYQRYCIERAITHCAHVFTTVSDITAYEAEHLLTRKADLVLPNGLRVKPTFLHEFQNQHSQAKEKIHDFIRGHFYGRLDFDLEKTLYFFTSGRYEFTNKGVDMFIEALARLNYYIKSAGMDITVVAFLIFPTKTNNFNVESLRGQAVAKQLRDTVSEIQKDIGARLFDMCIRGQLPNNEELLLKQNMVKLKRCIYASQRESLPPICTHNVVEDGTDLILCTLRRCKLLNNSTDRVKVIFHPEFLKSTNPLLGMEYEEFVRGCNLGVFPSYYEPWGYTPAECTVMGIPSVTTNLCGFGCFMQQHIADPLSYGIYIVDRRYRSPEESIQQLAQYMYDFAGQTKKQRIIQRNRTERVSELLDWKNLAIHYRKARYMALHRAFPTAFPEDEASVIQHMMKGKNLLLHTRRGRLWVMEFTLLDTPLQRDIGVQNIGYGKESQLSQPSSLSNSAQSTPRYADSEFDSFKMDDTKGTTEQEQVNRHSAIPLAMYESTGDNQQRPS